MVIASPLATLSNISEMGPRNRAIDSSAVVALVDVTQRVSAQKLKLQSRHCTTRTVGSEKE
jgi:hypothetical protein